MQMTAKYRGEDLTVDIVGLPSKRLGFSRVPHTSRGWMIWFLEGEVRPAVGRFQSRSDAKAAALVWEEWVEKLELPFESLPDTNIFTLKMSAWNKRPTIHIEKLLRELGV